MPACCCRLARSATTSGESYEYCPRQPSSDPSVRESPISDLDPDARGVRWAADATTARGRDIRYMYIRIYRARARGGGGSAAETYSYNTACVSARVIEIRAARGALAVYHAERASHASEAGAKNRRKCVQFDCTQPSLRSRDGSLSHHR